MFNKENSIVYKNNYKPELMRTGLRNMLYMLEFWMRGPFMNKHFFEDFKQCHKILL